MSVSKTKMEFWVDNNYNVCFSGKHGVGKTAQIKEIFNEKFGELGVDWLYFSASSMDPWVDFVGVPKERVSEDGVSYLSLVRPEVFARDQVKAIFIDEFNRSPKKVRNAVMELLQFGSINGHKFYNLRVIWTAINPSDDESNYDVEEIDPAQLDRFHVLVDVPYAVSKAYFVEKYGEEIGLGSTEWWNSLPNEAKDKVSPRRLDYILDCFTKGGDINDFLPSGINTKQLLTHINSGSIRKILSTLYKDQNEDNTAEKMDDPNFLDVAIDMILKDNKYVKYFIPFLSSERLSVLISKLNASKLKKLLSEIPSTDRFIENIDSIVEANNINGAKRKALIAWQSANVPLVPVLKNTNNVTERALVDISARALSVNTYHRLLDVKTASDIIKKSKDLSKAEAALYYNIILTGFMRSQNSTCYSLARGKTVCAAMKKCETVYPLKKFIKDGGNKIFKNDNAYNMTVRKLTDQKVVPSHIFH